MNELKFNSQICTTKEQSQRLLDLGLKPETADMILIHNIFSNTYEPLPKAFPTDTKCYIPAWSLHRLIEILPKIIRKIPLQWYLSITPYYNNMISYEHCGNMASNYLYKSSFNDIYANIISCIEWLISEDYFNKEYLKQ